VISKKRFWGGKDRGAGERRQFFSRGKLGRHNAERGPQRGTRNQDRSGMGGARTLIIHLGKKGKGGGLTQNV